MLTMLAKQNLSVLTITAGGFSWSHPLKYTNKGRSCGILSKVLVDISSVTEGPFRNVKDFSPPTADIIALQIEKENKRQSIVSLAWQ